MVGRILESWGLPGSEDSLAIGWAVTTEYQRVMNRQTDVQPISITCVHSMTVTNCCGYKW